MLKWEAKYFIQFNFSRTPLYKKFRSTDTFVMDKVNLRNRYSFDLVGVPIHLDLNWHKPITSIAASAEFFDVILENILPLWTSTRFTFAVSLAFPSASVWNASIQKKCLSESLLSSYSSYSACTVRMLAIILTITNLLTVALNSFVVDVWSHVLS